MKIKTEQDIYDLSMSKAHEVDPVAYSKGYDQAQSDLLEEFKKEEECWLITVNARDDKIKDLEDELRDLRRAELIQSDREDVLPAIQEAAHYNWLDDQVHEKDQLIFNLKSEYQEAVEDIEALLFLRERLRSKSVSCRAFAIIDSVHNPIKAKYGLDKQESKI